MTFWSDMDFDMHPVPLDLDTADRLLAGSVAPADAPPGYARVASLLEAASATPGVDELEHEREAVAILAAVVRSSSYERCPSPGRPFMPFTLSRPRLAAAFAAATLACTGGLASAGSLPGAAQDIAAAMLGRIGVPVPGPNEHSGTHPDLRGTSEDGLPDLVGRSEVTELATTTELEGVEKGAAVSTAASDGKSHAGQKGSAGSAHAGEPNVPTPQEGGTGTADAASGGKSLHGTSTAGTASGGHSGAGSANASDGHEAADTASGGRSSAGRGNGSGNAAP
jgi:hypothetical protein